jgi:3-hydroxyacyl-CoA dehydrogenase
VIFRRALGSLERMAPPHPSAIDILLADSRLGQKNGRGFYAYARDPKGRPRKDADPAVAALLAAGQPRGKASISDAGADNAAADLRGGALRRGRHRRLARRG